MERSYSLSLAGRHCLINSVIASSMVHTMMIYRWLKTLLHRLEVAIHSYLWMGYTNKKGFSNVDWKCFCAPLAEGGFGIRSLRLATASFCCKLAWNFLTTTDKQASFVWDHYFDKNGNTSNRRCISSIRLGLHDHIARLNDASFWLIGDRSKVNFWSDNWLSYRICDKINMPPDIFAQLRCSIGDYLFDS